MVFSWASIINATTPLVTAADILVPLSRRYSWRPSLPTTRALDRLPNNLDWVAAMERAGDREPAIRLRKAVIPRRAFRTVARDRVILVRDRAFRIQRSDGDSRWRVAGRRDSCIPGHACLRVHAVITRRSHHGDARTDRCLDGLNEGVSCRRFENGMSEREVENGDV